MLYKIFWLLRGACYSLFLGHVGLFSYIGKPLFICGWRKITIGRNVRIFPGLRIEAHGSSASISIKKNVSIAQFVHITAAGNLVIGSDSVILGFVFITDIEHEYSNIKLAMRDQAMVVRETKIGSNCFIGFGAAIQAGTILGDHCIVGAGAVVRGFYPDYSVIVGVPGRVVKQFDPATGRWLQPAIS